jgi:hypothetical protein
MMRMAWMVVVVGLCGCDADPPHGEDGDGSLLDAEAGMDAASADAGQDAAGPSDASGDGAMDASDALQDAGDAGLNDGGLQTPVDGEADGSVSVCESDPACDDGNECTCDPEGSPHLTGMQFAHARNGTANGS